MFRGFNLTIDDSDFSEFYLEGERIHLKNKTIVKEGLDRFLDDDGDLSASKIVGEWFPSIKADIFLSHSHKDEDMIIALAGWLNCKFQINSFIDSCVWGYSENLLKSIDNSYCRQPGKKTFYYDKRNRSTAHVYIMLSTALSKMIDDCEAVFFVNTPNSISSSDYISGADETLSPWIYSEIAMTRLVRKKSLSEYRGGVSLEEQTLILKSRGDLNVKYDVDLDHLIDLSCDDLNNWADYRFLRNARHPLDVLYKLKGF